MIFKTAIGFLGLLGIAVLILIYLLKPNYQQKIVSSTHIWKMSLKYRRKRIPVSKLRNLLIIICQILVISLGAFILAQPFFRTEAQPEQIERIAIIDSSASMNANQAGISRFQLAVEEVETLGLDTIDEGGRITVILAGNETHCPIYRVGSTDTFLDLLADIECGFSTSDMESAILFTEDIVADNPDAKIFVYTATHFVEVDQSIKVIPVDNGEWNAAILNCEAVLDAGYYRFDVTLACYGQGDYEELPLAIEIDGVNGEGIKLVSEQIFRSDYGTVETFTFTGFKVSPNNIDPSNMPKYDDLANYDQEIFLFSQVNVRFGSTQFSPFLEINDSLSYDNQYYIFGGTKEVIDVAYISSDPNIFFTTLLDTMSGEMKSRWDIQIKSFHPKNWDVAKNSGFDFYIFEHTMPQMLPTDGAILLVSPDQTTPENAGLLFTDIINAEGSGNFFSLRTTESHDLTRAVNPASIRVTRYRKIESYTGYTPLVYIGDDPALLIKNQKEEKVAVLSFSVNYSDISVLTEFPTLIYNIFNYFLPSTFVGNVFDAGDKIAIDSRGDILTLYHASGDVIEYDKFSDSFPDSIDANNPGVYTFTQNLISKDYVVESLFVKIPSAESNLYKIEGIITGPRIVKENKTIDISLLLYFAIAIVALLFIEWWLQSRDQF